MIKARNYIYWSLKLTFLFSNQYVFLFNFRYLWIEAWVCLDCRVVVLNFFFSTEILLLVSTEDGKLTRFLFSIFNIYFGGMIRINDSFKFVIWHYIIGVEDYYVAKLRCILSSIILFLHLKLILCIILYLIKSKFWNGEDFVFAIETIMWQKPKNVDS